MYFIYANLELFYVNEQPYYANNILAYLIKYFESNFLCVFPVLQGKRNSLSDN